MSTTQNEAQNVAQVQAVKLNGSKVRATSNPKIGYVMYRQETADIDGVTGWPKVQKLSFLVKGDKTDLMALPDTLPGTLYCVEVLASDEDSLPAECKAVFDKSKTFEENVARFAKRAAKDSPTLKQSGYDILRFTFYDKAGVKTNSLLSHDNIAEIDAWRNATNNVSTTKASTTKAAKAAKAQLA